MRTVSGLPGAPPPVAVVSVELEVEVEPAGASVLDEDEEVDASRAALVVDAGEPGTEVTDSAVLDSSVAPSTDDDAD